MAAEVWGGEPEAVVIEADNISALPHETPTSVLERIAGGETPRDVVLNLVAEALEVASGGIPDLKRLVEEIVEAEERAEGLVEVYGEGIREELLPQRLTPLDPQRPAIDLLEDLLSGVHGCWLIFREHADDSEVDVADSHLWSDDSDDEMIQEEQEASIAEFVKRVRQAANQDPAPSH